MKKITKLKKLKAEFGLKYSGIVLIERILHKINQDGILAHKMNRIRYNWIESYLTKNYSDLINKYASTHREYKILSSKYIWIFWWQGLESAPDLVKKCIQRVKNEARKINKNVIIIDKSNYDSYVSVPQEIVLKVKTGIFPYFFFADILRLCLLSSYGGIWIDATVFLKDEIELQIGDNLYFYTVKRNIGKKWSVARGLWSTFFLASGKKNAGLLLARDLMLQYAMDHNEIAAYFLLDACLAIAYDNVNSFREEVDEVPINNIKVFDMMKHINENVSSFEYPERINKLTYKDKVQIYNKNELTVYGAILKNKLN